MPPKLILGVGALLEAPSFRAVHEPPMHDPDHFLVKFLVLRHFPKVYPLHLSRTFLYRNQSQGNPAQTWFVEDPQLKSGCKGTSLTIQWWGPPHPGRRSKWNHSGREIHEESRMRNRGLVRQCCSSGTCEQGSLFEARR